MENEILAEALHIEHGVVKECERKEREILAVTVHIWTHKTRIDFSLLKERWK